MGILIEQQAVIDCLTNTAKYYEREDADEWTKGIHYGLLHGVDNILDDVPTVEAIPKDQYEARLRADMFATLGMIRQDLSDKLAEEKGTYHISDVGIGLERAINTVDEYIARIEEVLKGDNKEE